MLLLLNKGAYFKLAIAINSATLLMDACHFFHEAVAHILVRQGADIFAIVRLNGLDQQAANAANVKELPKLAKWICGVRRQTTSLH